jgi:hypothetical protein
MRVFIHAIALSGCLAVMFAPAAAQPAVPAAEPSATEKTTEPAPWWSTLTLNGMVMTGYTWNTNDPPSRHNTYRVFDFDHDVMKLDAIELVLQRDAGDDGAGFRIDIAAGSSIPRVVRSRGLDMGDLDIQQAFLRYTAPVAGGLSIDAGKFITPAGYEVIDGYDGINDNASRSILFGYAIPFTHTGVRAALSLVDELSITAYLVNGWDVAVDNNSARTVGLHLVAAPIETLTLSGCLFHGVESDSVGPGPRTLVDVVAAWRPSSTVTVGVNADLASEAGATATGGDAEWSGIAGYLRLNIAERFSLSARAEVFDDRDGVRTGVVQTLQSYTLTPELRVADGLALRSDLRLDRSNEAVFETSSEPVSTQVTIGLQAVLTF